MSDFIVLCIIQEQAITSSSIGLRKQDNVSALKTVYNVYVCTVLVVQPGIVCPSMALHAIC